MKSNKKEMRLEREAKLGWNHKALNCRNWEHRVVKKLIIRSNLRDRQSQ
jgi:hypothetical protein